MRRASRHKYPNISFWRALTATVAVAVVLMPAATTSAIGSQQNPQSGSVGLEGTIASPPPTQAATIATPGNGQTVTSIPITVSGLCKTGLLVKIFSNNIFVGAAQCNNGSYSLQISLFSGRNDLVARVYDALDQAGPDSNLVTVTFNDGQFAQFGTRVSLTSTFAKLGADPGKELDWPILLSGGVGPYALSVDWGDGKPANLQSIQFPGELTIKHVYSTAGIYNIIVKATDKNGTVAFLQLVGVANGKVTQAGTSSGSGSSGGTNTNTATTTTKTSVLWWPALLLLPLIMSSFWLGRRHELFTLRKRMEQTRNEF